MFGNQKESYKLKLFNSNIKSVLLYRSETWRATKTTTQKLQTFINRCLSKILGIKWMDRVVNDELWNRSGQQTVGEELMKRKWRWIGHKHIVLKAPLKYPKACKGTHKAKEKKREASEHLDEGSGSRCRTY